MGITHTEYIDNLWRREVEQSYSKKSLNVIGDSVVNRLIGRSGSLDYDICGTKCYSLESDAFVAFASQSRGFGGSSWSVSFVSKAGLCSATYGCRDIGNIRTSQKSEFIESNYVPL